MRHKLRGAVCESLAEEWKESARPHRTSLSVTSGNEIRALGRGTACEKQ